MLRKLLKYDFKSMYKFLIIFYLLALFFAVLTRIFFAIDNSIIGSIIAQICTGATIALIFNILINNLMRCWVLFKNMYGDESYLTHTLPVSKKEIYTSKFITAFTTLLTSILIVSFTLFIAYYSKDNFELLKEFVGPIANLFKSSPIALIVALIFMIFIEFFNILQTGYTGIILGHRKNNNKVLYSVISGFIVYMITQLFVLAGIFVVAIFNSDLMNFFFTTDNINLNMFKSLYILCTVIYFIAIIVLYYINVKILNKGVNID